MKSVLIIFLLTVLRLGIPAMVVLSIGETVRRHYENVRSLRGA